MIDWLKNYAPYIVIILIGSKLIYWDNAFAIGGAIIIGGCLGWYHFADKKILKSWGD